MSDLDRTQYYRERDFNGHKPKWSANHYFYIVHCGGHVWKSDSGLQGHMEQHLREYPDHTITWLEPEHEYDPDTYYKRISHAKTQ